VDNLVKNVDGQISTWAKLKPKFFEILITAILSAALAFIQSLITNAGNFNNPTIDPEVAGGIGASLRAILLATKTKFC